MTLTLCAAEIEMIYAALNETTNGIREINYQSQLRANREVVRALCEIIYSVAKDMDDSFQNP